MPPVFGSLFEPATSLKVESNFFQIAHQNHFASREPFISPAEAPDRKTGFDVGIGLETRIRICYGPTSERSVTRHRSGRGSCAVRSSR
jgi:hypothetical protein